MSKNFFDQVYEVVQRIPSGKVMTYGQIAKILSTRDARRVGHALHANKNSEVPCHRVVNKNGGLSKSFAFNGIEEHRSRLEKEGIIFDNLTQVNLKKYQYIIN